MQNTEVFYHLYIPPSYTYNMWTWWVDEQLRAIRDSKLSDIAVVNMAITMPKYWILDDNHPETLQITVMNYIKNRYPFVKILDVRDTGDVNIYEGHTLSLLHQACQQRDMNVLYVHSKGTVSHSVTVNCWRQILNHFCVNQWPRCLKQLNNFDLVGVKDAKCADTAVSGNIWWSKSQYIKQLPDPVESQHYQMNPEFHPDGASYRYTFEDWISVNTPSVFHVANTRTDHYKHCCFLEDMV